jgi:hypothetical protein
VTLWALLLAGPAGLGQLNLEVLGKTSVGFLEGDLEFVFVVGTTYGTPGTASEHLREDVVGVEASWKSIRISLGSLGVPKLVVVLALLWVAEDVVGALDLLEFFDVTRWFIRVKSKSEFAIGLLDLLFGGASLDPEGLVGVTHLILD